jgi:hypothetical protein
MWSKSSGRATKEKVLLFEIKARTHATEKINLNVQHAMQIVSSLIAKGVVQR